MSSVTVAAEVAPPEAPIEPTPGDNLITERPDNVPEKFWNAEKGEVNTEALLQAQADTEAALTKANQGETSESESTVDEETASALSKAGLDVNVFDSELKADGALSQGSYDKLAEAGYSKAMVDQYLAGANNVQAEASAVATLEAQEIAEVKNSVENLDDALNWAKEGLTPEQQKSYNNMIESGNKQQAMAAVTWLGSLYAEAEGSEPNLNFGDGGDSDTSKFTSSAEITAAMKDKRYGKDAAYTRSVERKVGRSKVF